MPNLQGAGLGVSFCSPCVLFKNERIISRTGRTNINLTRNSEETGTHMFSRMIFVSRFLRFWWKLAGKRASTASAEDRSRNAASLVRRCRAWSSCRRDGEPRAGGEEKCARRWGWGRGTGGRALPPTCHTLLVIQQSPTSPEASAASANAHVPTSVNKAPD